MTTYRRSKDLGTVVQSVNLNGETICVDFFQRQDGTFGYEEYRRDVETGEGWFPIGFYSGNIFSTIQLAKDHAIRQIGWLDTEL